MKLSGDIEERRAKNARGLAAFGMKAASGWDPCVRTIREGTGVTIYTIGYERRDGDGLISALKDQAIAALADVRERPMSRKADFRSGALRKFCEAARIEYQPWSMLGSTAQQRDELQASGDFHAFERQFRHYAETTMKTELERLATSVSNIPTALLCYERAHNDCHRSVIADLVAQMLDATIIAIE